MLRLDLRLSLRIVARGLLLPAVLAVLVSCTALPEPIDQVDVVDEVDEVTQISTYPALEMGLYDGDVTYAQLAQAGNFGIGTFDSMDGEMMALDGQFYQARADGAVRRADKTQETPFATVTFFSAEQRVQPAESLAGYDQLKAYLARVAPPTNRPYAIRIDGSFPYVKIRSVPRQSEPYPPLADVVAQQVTWEQKDMRGTLVGYWFPEYLSALVAPGYHLHFISDDRQVAGHLLDCSLDGATVAIDYLDQVTLRIPQTATFAAMDFSTKP
jgi:acetolactate decarboxylase